MTRRQVTPSSRKSNRLHERRNRVVPPPEQAAFNAERNNAELVETETQPDQDILIINPGIEDTYTDLTTVDLTNADDASNLDRRRTTTTPTPNRGLQKKKARIDLTQDSAESEDDVSYPDSGSSTSECIPSPPSTVRTPNQEILNPARTMAEAVTTNPGPMRPAALNMYKSCRYAAQLLVPAHAEPVKKAGELLHDAFKEIQRQAGNKVWLAAWHSADDNLVCKKPSELPRGTTAKDRDSFTRIFDNYMVLTPETEQRLFLKLHFVTESPDTLFVHLPDIGKKVEALEDRYHLKIQMHPNPCQSSRVSTLGWGFGTVKSMDGQQLTKALRQALNMPDHIAMGVQWRTIADKSGRKYPWPRDRNAPRPPQALHFDIDDAYVGVWYPKFAKLFKKGASKRVNFLQIRLIPCFTTQIGKTLSDVMARNTHEMASKQLHFVNKFTTRLTTSHIQSLDTPIGERNITLRRYLMMKAPDVKVTDRLFVTVDSSFRGSDHTLTTTTMYSDQALRVINTMIPECIHLYGMDATRWFTPSGLMAYQDIKWDPVTHGTTSIHDEVLVEMVEEDFFGMGMSWKCPENPNPQDIEFEGIDTNVTGQTVREILDARARGGIHDDTPSFGDAFGRSHSGTTVAPPQRQTNKNSGSTQGNTRRVEFDNSVTTQTAQQDNGEEGSISTMGTEVTSGSTRRHLRQQVDMNQALRDEGRQMAAEIKRLEARLASQGINAAQRPPQSPDDSSDNSNISLDTVNTQDNQLQPSARKGTSSIGADSAGQHT